MAAAGRALVVGGVLTGNAVLAFRVRRWFTSRKAMQRPHRGSGAVMIGAGLAVIASATACVPAPSQPHSAIDRSRTAA